MENRKQDKSEWKFSTLCVHAGHDVLKTGTIAPPIYQSVAYPYESAEYAAKLFRYEIEGYMYGRMDNPTNDMFEKRIAALELTEKALATSSGMAAEFLSCFELLKTKNEFVTSAIIYGGTNQLFTNTFAAMGKKAKFIFHPEDLEEWKKAITPETAFLYVETPSNPNLFIGDIEELAKLAHDHEIPLIVDNTVATPALQQPAKLGADIIVHSATKYLSGNSTCISGVVASSGEYIDKLRSGEYRNIGPSLSPFNSWLLLLGLETLPLRMAKHSHNALVIAEFLEEHPKVIEVNYPGLSSHPQHNLAKKQMTGYSALLSFVTKGELQDARRVIDAFKLIVHTGHLGTTKTLATHPAFTTHQQLSKEEREAIGIKDTLIRLSIGIEDEEDLIEDLDKALKLIP